MLLPEEGLGTFSVSFKVVRGFRYILEGVLGRLALPLCGGGKTTACVSSNVDTDKSSVSPTVGRKLF